MKVLQIASLLLIACSLPLHAQFSDEFDQDALDAGWSWLRESPANWQLGNDALTIWTENGALNGTEHNNVRNLLLQPLDTESDFMIDTELRFVPYWTLRNAGLLYHVDDDNYIRVSRGINDGHDDIWLEWEVDGVTQFRYAGASVGTWADPIRDIRLRLTRREGNQFSASYCIGTGGGVWTDWHSFATETIALSSAVIRIGLQAANGDGMMATTLPTTAVFSYFHFNKGTSVVPLRAATVAFAVEAAHPTPARVGSQLRMDILTDRAAVLQWRMTDILGREVIATQRLGHRDRGTHSITVPTGSLSPGVYLWHISDGGSSRATRRIVLTR
jgi:regulation of enolase protein 1 (concanavalin A-like superfamily)